MNANNTVNATDDDKSVQNIHAVLQVNEDDDDEDISALISAQDSTLDDSLTSIPYDTTQLETSRTETSSVHSSPRSTRYGSYDVNPSVPSPVSFDYGYRHGHHDLVSSPTQHMSPPVFTPPPPPDSPPPSVRNSCEYREKQTDTESMILYNHRDGQHDEEEEGWREWLTLDNDNVDIIDPPDMEDRCVGTTPRDSMSVISSRTVSSVNTVMYSNIQNDNLDNSINNNNNEVEHIFNNEEITHSAQSPSRSITSARSSPIKYVAAVSPVAKSGHSFSTDGRNSSVVDDTVDKTSLHRSPSRNSVSSITSYRSAVLAQRAARLDINTTAQSPNKNSVSSANSYNLNTFSASPAVNEHRPKLSDIHTSQQSPSKKSISSVTSYTSNGSVAISRDSNSTASFAIHMQRPNHSDAHTSQQLPSRKSISSVTSYTSDSSVSRSRYSDSTASPSRLYTIGFPVGGFGIRNSVHSDTDDESDTEVEVANVQNDQLPVQNTVYSHNYTEEVYEGEDILMVVLSKESKSLGKYV